ncbi:MAG: glycosyltransferase family 4 protein [Verrucomicrobia subdivision 3 bacterium]|nr:glycosyltransferase family 4 protein [Limisphaerales bacterium]
MMRIVQIVRRFGPVGGMETYAWQLTRALAANGRPVRVVCETNESDPMPGVTVDALGSTNSFPRWRHHLQFSRRVADFRQQHPQPRDLWHSHESVTCAEVGTFHSTIHGAGEARAWHKRFDPTWHLNRWIEKRVIFSPRLKQMVAVSNLVREQLRHAHPKQAHKFASHISPGVEPIEKPAPIVTEPILGFIGREWKRKGLRRVLEILQAIPEAKLVIAGVPPDEISGLLGGLQDRVEILGWIDDPADFYKRIRLLIHPAKLEAYGMVVPEALARSVPVLASEATGASADMGAAGRALPHTAPAQSWADAARELLAHPPKDFPPIRSWAEVAEEYHLLYQGLTL